MSLVTIFAIIGLMLAGLCFLLIGLYYLKTRQKNFDKDERMTALSWKSNTFAFGAAILYLGLIVIALAASSASIETDILAQLFVSTMMSAMLGKFGYLDYKLYLAD